jgi:hypothetical protein
MKRLSTFVRLVAICGGAIGIVLSNEATSSLKPIWLQRLGLLGWFPNLMAILIVAAIATVEPGSSHSPISSSITYNLGLGFFFGPLASTVA